MHQFQKYHLSKQTLPRLKKSEMVVFNVADKYASETWLYNLWSEQKTLSSFVLLRRTDEGGQTEESNLESLTRREWQIIHVAPASGSLYFASPLLAFTLQTTLVTWTFEIKFELKFAL